MKYWDTSLKIANERSKYIQNIIRGRSAKFSGDTDDKRYERATQTMYHERTVLKMTVFNYINYRKSHDPAKKNEREHQEQKMTKKMDKYMVYMKKIKHQAKLNIS